MKPLYHIFRPKMRESTFEEITKHVIDLWNTASGSQYCNGSMLYIDKTNPGEAIIQYCDTIMTISKHKHIGYDGGVRTNEIRIGYRSTKEPSISTYTDIITILPGKVLLSEKKRDEDEYVNFATYDITVPEELLNEIDFFQFETLNPILPISPTMLIKLYHTINKDM